MCKTAKANIRRFDILKRRLSWKCEFVQFFLLANMEPDPGQLIKPDLISGQSTLSRSPDIRTLKQNCSDQEKVEMPEGKLSAVWDRCLADGIVKTGAGDKICQHLLLCLSKAPSSFLHPDLTAIWFVTSLQSPPNTTGGALGSLFSLVLFKRKLWPVTFGLGIGFGIACSNCQHEVFDL